MMLVRLNTRHELPQLGIRQTQAKLDESGIIQPRIRGTGNRQAQANKTVTQPSLYLDNYPSRRAYGHRTMNDLTAEQGQRGIANVQSATSKHTQEGWTKATNAAKRGDDVVQNARSEMFSKYQARILFRIDAIPDPQMQGQPNQVIGEPDLGNISVDIETAPSARIRYTPGSVETYLQNEGFIRHWVSYDSYDIYA
jgi:hypothetical protein